MILQQLKENKIPLKEQHRDIKNLENKKADLLKCQKNLNPKFDELKIENNSLQKVHNQLSS